MRVLYTGSVGAKSVSCYKRTHAKQIHVIMWFPCFFPFISIVSIQLISCYINKKLSYLLSYLISLKMRILEASNCNKMNSTWP